MAQEFNTGLLSVTANLLEVLKVPFTKKVLKQRLETNPYYPALYKLNSCKSSYNSISKASDNL